jgi:hypothetical protein
MLKKFILPWQNKIFLKLKNKIFFFYKSEKLKKKMKMK